jgi:hypothetical protein
MYTTNRRVINLEPGFVALSLSGVASSTMHCRFAFVIGPLNNRIVLLWLDHYSGAISLTRRLSRRSETGQAPTQNPSKETR